MGQVVAIVPAAGKGVRMGLKGGKQFVNLAGKPALAHTLSALEASREIDAIIVVTAADQVTRCWQLINEYTLGKVQSVVPGGDSRQESVWIGLQRVPDDTEIVVVHDGARPLVETELVNRAIEAARIHKAVGIAVPVKDTIKVRDTAGFVVSTPPRSTLWAMQTPQAFQYDILYEAHSKSIAEGVAGTDDCMLVEALGCKVLLIEGSYRNLKLTTREDLALANALLADGEPEPALQSQDHLPTVRVGWGYDVHRLVEGRPLILGGIDIPYTKGLLGHSDADVLVHAIMDALLGAAALGDIGSHFPDTDPRWEGANSMDLLKQVSQLLAKHLSGGEPAISSIDSVIMAQRPRLAPYIPQMRLNIAQVLGLSLDQVSIKATTTEGLGPVGQGEGIVAQAVVTLLT